MEDKNLAHMFLNRSRSHKKNPFILSYRKDNWNVLSWRYARRTVRKLCLGFISLGVKPGDRVALLSTNRAKWVFCDLAILSAGGVVVPIQHNSTPGQIRHIVRDSKSRFLIIADYKQLRKFTTNGEEYPDVEKIIVMEMVSGIKEGDKLITSFSEIQMRGKSHHRSHTFEEHIDQIDMDDPATINYTTDVEGEVKGIILTHGNIYSNLKAIGDILSGSEEDITLHSLPLTYGPCRLFGYFSPIYSGGTMVIADKADMEEKLFQSTKPTIALVVPRNLESIRRKIIVKVESGGALRRKLYPWALEVGKRVLENKTAGKDLSFSESIRHFIANLFVFKKIRSDFGGRMKFCICSGAPLVYKLAEFFHIIGMPVFDAYGMTESSYLIAMNRPDDFKLGTVGKAIPGVKIRLSKNGEIQCHGANIMKEFLDDEQKTIQAVPGHWLSSGDLGEIDEDGFLKITGREKDVIITSGGETIAPKVIEHALTINRHIKQVSIIGNDRKYITAIIVPDLEELRAYAKANGFHFTDMTDLLYSDEVRTLLEQAVSEVNKDLIKHEALVDFIIAESDFTTANNMLTAAQRNNRSVIEKYYATQIERMYES